MQAHKIILLIEDNEQDELLTIRALKKNGIRHEIHVCRDGAEALDWIHRRGVHQNRSTQLQPDVILLDLKLPKRSGHEVLSAIRAHSETRLTPVVILTTSKEESDIAKSYQSGANSYIQKPVSFEEFEAAVKNLGEYWLLLNQPPSRRFSHETHTP